MKTDSRDSSNLHVFHLYSPSSNKGPAPGESVENILKLGLENINKHNELRVGSINIKTHLQCV